MSPRVTLIAASLIAFGIGLPLLVQIYFPARWPLDVVEHAIGRDFVNVWVGGRLLREGNWQVLFTLQGYFEALHRLFHPALPPHFWSYPPSNFLLAVPFGLLPYGPALATWTLVGLGFYFWTAGLDLARGARREVWLLLAIAPATAANIIGGQNGFLTAALLGGGFLLLGRAPVRAGILLGLLTYKPHFGLVAAPVLLALGAWTTIASAAATAVALAGASILLFGIDPWLRFLEFTVPNQGRMLAGFEGFFTTMLVSPYATLRHLGMAHGAAMGAQVMLLALVGGGVAWMCRRTADADVRLALVATGTFVASPYTLTYDLPIVALVIARLAARSGAAWPRPQALALGAAWALPLAGPMLVAYGWPIAGLVMPATLAALIWGTGRTGWIVDSDRPACSAAAASNDPSPGRR